MSMPIGHHNLVSGNAPNASGQIKSHKIRKQEEGFEGLPDDFKNDLEIEDAE